MKAKLHFIFRLPLFFLNRISLNEFDNQGGPHVFAANAISGPEHAARPFLTRITRPGNKSVTTHPISF